MSTTETVGGYNACLVVDMQGFQYRGGRFLVRELAWADSEGEGDVLNYRQRQTIAELNSTDLTMVAFASRRVHGLPFKLYQTEKARSPTTLSGDLKRLFESARHRARNDASQCKVAYKEGHTKRDALTEGRLPHVNLEDWECPKFDLLRAPTLKAAATSRCPFHSIKPT